MNNKDNFQRTVRTVIFNVSKNNVYYVKKVYSYKVRLRVECCCI